VVDGVTGEWKELDQAGCHGILPASAPPPQVSPNPPGQGYRPPSSAPHVPYTPDTLPQEKP